MTTKPIFPKKLRRSRLQPIAREYCDYLTGVRCFKPNTASNYANAIQRALWTAYHQGRSTVNADDLASATEGDSKWVWDSAFRRFEEFLTATGKADDVIPTEASPFSELKTKPPKVVLEDVDEAGIDYDTIRQIVREEIVAAVLPLATRANVAKIISAIEDSKDRTILVIDRLNELNKARHEVTRTIARDLGVIKEEQS